MGCEGRKYMSINVTHRQMVLHDRTSSILKMTKNMRLIE